MDLPFIIDTMEQLLGALPMTLMLLVLSVSIGCLIATAVCWMRVSGIYVLDRFARAYILVFRGSPLLIQMFLVYYGLGQFEAVRSSIFWLVLRDPFWCAVISLALCTGGYTAEIFRGGLIAVPPNEVEAARAIGMSGFTLFRRIIGPVALRYVLPAYSTEVILMAKSTSLASLVTVWEVTGVAQRIITHTYRTSAVFLCAAVIYLVLNYIIVRLFGFVEYRLSAHHRERPNLAMPSVVAVPGN
jgi:octopine/nopaline transport system permease protein